MSTTIRYEETTDGVKTVRYVQGWRDPEQDRKPPPKVARIVSQDYQVIKRECLGQGALWEDPSFPANNKSVFPSGREWKTIEWRRPGDLCKDPLMFVDGFERSDVQQGELGNCWFLAAIGSLCATANEDLFHQVVPLDNLFGKDYAGVFHFKFWQYGKWVDVVVDDRLPTVNGRLVFVHSPTNNEFWPALLEKAYAKLNGSYEALESGSSTEAMQDFTGGVTENFNLELEVPPDLFKIMRKAFERDSLLGCSVSIKHSNGDAEGKLPNGLITGHAYSITYVKQITVRGSTINLIRVRNPWADSAEWNGAWSDGSPEWKNLSEADKKSLDLTFADDGEFWMSYEDFIINFSQVEMCMTVLAFDAMRMSVGIKKQWEMTSHEGSWKKFVNAGGCRNYLETFSTNPQYKVQVVAADEGEEDNTGTLIVALMQKDRRKQIAELGSKMLAIGYYIYKIPDSHVGPQDIKFFKKTAAVTSSSTFINVREVVGRHKLHPGSYLIIPCTFEPNEEGDFVLRIFSENRAPAAEIDEDTSFIERPRYKLVETQDHRDEERDLKELFRRTAGSDLEVDAYELRSILDSQFRVGGAESKINGVSKTEGVSLETARSMVALMDLDHSGKLGYDEFKNLWTDLRRWKAVFVDFDVSKTNSLSSFEMRAVLSASGFLVSNHTLNCLVMRYSDQKGFVQFDDFMLCVVRLKTMFETFRGASVRDRQTHATFSLDQFIQTTMYA